MQIIIDTAVDTLADINLATYCLEVLKARHGQPREEKQMDLPLMPESRHEIFPLTKEQLGPNITHVVALNELSEADVASLVSPQLVVAGNTPLTGSIITDVSAPVSPQPVSNTVDARDNPFRGHSDSAPNPGVPDPVPAPPASDVAQLPAYLRNRLPEVPSLAVDEDTDTAGVKWDATLHSESRSKTADGTWRKRRTAKNVVVTNVGDTPVVLADVSTLPTELLGTLPAMIPPPPPVALVIPPPPPTAVVTTFRELMEQMTIHMASRKVTSKDINAICHEHGIESLQMCFDNTALIPSVHTAIHKIAMKAGV